MSIDDISGNSSPLAGIGSRIKQFRDGKFTISRKDLEDTKAGLESLGLKTTAFNKVLDDFDKIDINGDGIGNDELTSYLRDAIGVKSDNGQHNGPKSIGLDDLTGLRDKISKDGGKADVLDSLIQNFSTADSNSDQKLSFHELLDYLKSQGLKFPSNGHRPPPNIAVPDVTASSSEVAATAAAGNLGQETSTSPDSSSNNADLVRMLLKRFRVYGTPDDTSALSAPVVA